MPYTAGDRDSTLADMRVFRLSLTADAATLQRSVESLGERLAQRWEERAQQERAERERAAGLLEGLARAGERVLAQIEALEVAKAGLEADLLGAYAALHTIEAQ